MRSLRGLKNKARGYTFRNMPTAILSKWSDGEATPATTMNLILKVALLQLLHWVLDFLLPPDDWQSPGHMSALYLQGRGESGLLPKPKKHIKKMLGSHQHD